MKAYFYSKTKQDSAKNKYTVYEVEATGGNLDVAERRCRTIAKQQKDSLAGGYFSGNCLPYNFKEDYTIIKVPLKTRVSPYDKHDRFIIDLIESESNAQYQIL